MWFVLGREKSLLPEFPYFCVDWLRNNQATLSVPVLADRDPYIVTAGINTGRKILENPQYIIIDFLLKRVI